MGFFSVTISYAHKIPHEIIKYRAAGCHKIPVRLFFSVVFISDFVLPLRESFVLFIVSRC